MFLQFETFIRDELNIPNYDPSTTNELYINRLEEYENGSFSFSGFGDFSFCFRGLLLDYICFENGTFTITLTDHDADPVFFVTSEFEKVKRFLKDYITLFQVSKNIYSMFENSQ